MSIDEWYQPLHYIMFFKISVALMMVANGEQKKKFFFKDTISTSKIDIDGQLSEN